jgi:hypothetical protein
VCVCVKVCIKLVCVCGLSNMKLYYECGMCERKMNENNVIELWIVGIEYVVIMVVYEYLVYKVSLGYVALTLVYGCLAGM